jgi:hopanoid-associated phosphorylase
MTIVAVSGLMREARLVGGPDVRTVVGAGDSAALRRKLADAIAQGAHGIISIGIAGGLDPSLKSGDCLIASEVVTGGERISTDSAWSARMSARLPYATVGPLAGAASILVGKAAKSDLFRATGAYAVDTESDVAAELARAHRLPFTVLRTISDPAGSELPALAAKALTPEGRVNVVAVLRSLLKEPRQLPDLARTARESKAAFDALLRCRRALGPGLLGPDGGELALDMR